MEQANETASATQIEVPAEGPSEADVRALVRGFYGRIEADPLLGPLFRMAVPDWEAHLLVIEDFWSRVLRGTDRYRGCVMGAHGGMRLKAAHFDRWMALFAESAAATLAPPARARAMEVAGFVDSRLRLGIPVPD